MGAITIRRSKDDAVRRRALELVGKRCKVLWLRQWWTAKIVDADCLPGEMMVFSVDSKAMRRAGMREGLSWMDGEMWFPFKRVEVCVDPPELPKGLKAWGTMEQRPGIAKQLWNWVRKG